MSAALINRIVLATDLGPGSQELLAHGVRMALSSGARLCVVHAHRGGGPARPWDVRPVVADMLRTWSADARQGRTALDLVQASADGDRLAQTAESFGPDLIIVGTERRHGVDRLVRGSTAERLARHFSVATLFVGQGARSLVHPTTGELLLHRVLVPVGDGVSAQDALDAALAFLTAAGASDARIDLHHAGDQPTGLPDVVHAPDRAVEWRWTPGPAVAGILAEAATCDADLIVMVTRGHDSVTDDLLGSRTERVMRDAPCPVLAVPLSL